MTITIVKREEAGSCNGCQDHTTDKVALICLNTLALRLCASCALELWAKLGSLQMDKNVEVTP